MTGVGVVIAAVDPRPWLRAARLVGDFHGELGAEARVDDVVVDYTANSMARLNIRTVNASNHQVDFNF